MRIRRGLLFWGLFLIPLGAVPLLVRAGTVDAASLTGAWRLWPVILIALGIALVAGRSQVAVIGTAVTAIILGIAAGGVLATGNPWVGLLGDCTSGGRTTAQADQHGSFGAPATVRLELNCGRLNLSAQTGADWSFHADYNGPPPIVTAASDRLDIRSPSSGVGRNHVWDLQVPSDSLASIDLRANAGMGTFNLAGAHLTSFKGEVNAADLSVDAAEATLATVDLTMNAGRARVTLGSGSVNGRMSVNAGAIDLCVPRASQLRIHLTNQVTFAHNLDQRGLTQAGNTWTRAGGNLDSVIELTVEGAAAAFNPRPGRWVSMSRRLYRSRDDRMLAGVAGGLAELWGPTRRSSGSSGPSSCPFTGGVALLVYVVMAFVVPEEDEVRPSRRRPQEPRNHRHRHGRRDRDRRPDGRRRGAGTPSRWRSAQAPGVRPGGGAASRRAARATPGC